MVTMAIVTFSAAEVALGSVGGAVGAVGGEMGEAHVYETSKEWSVSKSGARGGEDNGVGDGGPANSSNGENSAARFLHGVTGRKVKAVADASESSSPFFSPSQGRRRGTSRGVRGGRMLTTTSSPQSTASVGGGGSTPTREGRRGVQ